MTNSWCGTEEYIAPEVIAAKGHGKPADYWSMGALLYDMLVGVPPFYSAVDKSRKKLYDRILKAKFKLPGYLTREAHSILRSLLTCDPDKRLSDPNEVRQHPFFKGVHWDKMRKREVRPPIQPILPSPTSCFSPSLGEIPLSPEVQRSPVMGSVDLKTDPLGHDLFNGFSFLAPGLLQSHFEGWSTSPRDASTATVGKASMVDFVDARIVDMTSVTMSSRGGANGRMDKGDSDDYGIQSAWASTTFDIAMNQNFVEELDEVARFAADAPTAVEVITDDLRNL
mmetsp:Transcript_12929/g.26209  ORF Transcript_12929/g.26209 Transcript_12929/m.26209 type:complete len:282 (+) Transcript_12929:34-879(+)